VNLFVMILLGAGLFFLDSYRTRLIEEREDAARTQAELLIDTIPMVAPDKRGAYIAQFGN
jgi:two-component system sensor histidine kinase ChvG